jgi:beta-carotene ketolase (CrtW type)
MVIFWGWFATLIGLLPAHPDHWSPLAVVLAVPGRTFLQTGLFILGHDAMHRSLVPGRPALNDGLGRLALLLYAGLPFGPCRRHHLRHHRSPGSTLDPDFRLASGDGPLRWYVRFMGNYLSWKQLGLLLITWLASAALLTELDPHQRAMNVIAFWVLPLVLSSFQLFLFGTFLPHRSQGTPGAGSDAVQSLGYAHLLSLLACYHFGYHWEHHAYPAVPWFRLPELRRHVSLDHGQGIGSRRLGLAR